MKNSLTFSRCLALACSLCAFSVFATAAEKQTTRKPNVLMIAVDDLNDWIGCMGGHSQAITPNIDRLAKEGTLFLNNHCQAPICGPSRASVMTGLHPITSGIYLQLRDTSIQKANPAVAKSVFLTDWFERHGYKSMGAGKILHNGVPSYPWSAHQKGLVKDHYFSTSALVYDTDLRLSTSQLPQAIFLKR